MDSGDRLVSVLQARRVVFDEENASLSPEEREHKWLQYWNDVTSQIISSSSAPSHTTSLVPQKRSSCTAQLGLESGPKRSAVGLLLVI